MITKQCLQCTHKFETYPSKIGRFCSNKCKSIFYARKGDKNPSWKGKKAGYSAFHHWLVQHYGNANQCENVNCRGRSKIFEWAKLENAEYKHKRENYWMLCRSCHRKYDGVKPNSGQFQKGHVPWMKGRKQIFGRFIMVNN